MGGVDIVPAEVGCPKCGERMVDRLLVDDDQGLVRCYSCRHQYSLQSGSAAGGSAAPAECPLAVFAAVGPFSDELILGDPAAAIARLAAMGPLDAVRLLLAATRRSDAVVGDREVDDLAAALGVFEDEETGEDGNG